MRAVEGIKARALEFILLTAVRVADICGGGKDHSVPMLWSHVDETAKVWTIPDTKMGRAHRAAERRGDGGARPDAALQGPDDYVFPGAVRGTVIADSTLRYLLGDMGYAGLATTHGMRATFNTWALETTGYDEKIIDSCLAHAQDGQDAAYHRGSYLQKRRALMSLWASYLVEGEAASLGSTVVALRA